jgi:predicted RNase H-like HicB family nuclease
MIDVSDYIIEAFNNKWGSGMYIKTEDEDGNPTLLVNIIGIEEFELDLMSAEQAIIDEGVDPDDYVVSVIETVHLAGDDIEATFKEIAKAMELIFEALISLDIEHTVGDCVEDEDEKMCIGLWINIGIYPVPFYFKESWENLVRDNKDSEDYVKYIIVKHTGKLP